MVFWGMFFWDGFLGDVLRCFGGCFFGTFWDGFLGDVFLGWFFGGCFEVFWGMFFWNVLGWFFGGCFFGMVFLGMF